MTMMRKTLAGPVRAWISTLLRPACVVALALALAYVAEPASHGTSPVVTVAPAPAPAVGALAPAQDERVAPALAPAVCGTDTECAAWSLAHGAPADPLLGDDGEPYCLPGAALYDTEDEQQGDTGLVCVPETSGPMSGARALDDDDPAFDCRFDGNQQCGPGSDGGPLVSDYVPGAPPYVWCPVGGPRDGLVVVNGAGVLVCDYSPRRTA